MVSKIMEEFNNAREKQEKNFNLQKMCVSFLMIEEYHPKNKINPKDIHNITSKLTKQ